MCAGGSGSSAGSTIRKRRPSAVSRPRPRGDQRVARGFRCPAKLMDELVELAGIEPATS
jgi:hypothetical protein